MATETEKKYAEKRQQLARAMAQEEQQAGAFHQLRESYMKMLTSRFSLLSEGAQWRKANRLAAQDYIARVDEMRHLYVQHWGSSKDFQEPALYWLVKADFNPFNAIILKEESENLGQRVLAAVVNG